jgi:hypothetical protein
VPTFERVTSRQMSFFDTCMLKRGLPSPGLHISRHQTVIYWLSCPTNSHGKVVIVRQTARCRPGALASLGKPSSQERSGSSASPCAAELCRGNASLDRSGLYALTCSSGRSPLRGFSCPSAAVV